MKNIFITFLFACFAAVACKAQDYAADSVYYTPIPKTEVGKKKGMAEDEMQLDRKLAYFFTIQSGALIGCKDCSFKREVSFSASTIHGVTIGKKLRIGAGIGFDTYQNWQTMPLFGSISWDLLGHRNKNAVFIQFNYGWATAWASGLANYFQNIQGGRMVSTLAGYRIKYHDLRLSFGIGYKYQSVAASYEYPRYYYDYIGTRFTGDANSYKLQESLNRLSLTMIFGWK